jgi:transcription-repair coupling factor (superfamily II helicase)
MSIAESAAGALDRVRNLPIALSTETTLLSAVAALQTKGAASFEGVWGSSSALLAAALLPHAPGGLVVICPTVDGIDSACDDLALFSDAQPIRFPAWEATSGERVIHDDVYGERLRTLKQLLAISKKENLDRQPRQAPLVVTSIQSLVQPVPDPDELRNSTRSLRVGDTFDVDELLKWLAEHRFHGSSAVELPGEFSARGGILDVFAPDWQQPIRIELFGDEVASLRQFEVSSQRSLAALEEVEITVFRSKVKPAEHLTSYLRPDCWLLLIDPETALEHAQQYLNRLERPQDSHSVNQVTAECQKFGFVTATGVAQGQLGAGFQLQTESVERFSGEVSRVREELERVGENDSVYLITTTEAEIERLKEILGTTNLSQEGRLHYVVGYLSEGFRLLHDNAVLISANQLFQRSSPRRIARRHLGKAIDSFVDLREGDLVVHLSHGIGRYRGVELLDKQGNVEEHLQIEFAGGAKLYVPATKIDLVQKYVGGNKTRPSLARLGGAAWARHKQAAEAAVMDMAAEMLELQAERMSRPGNAVAIDGEWQQEFDASFPYEETDDQLVAIREIKSDMQSAQSMDRLLCGDVGFGKTELAMRAAFKAVDNGFQVALLVPTTVLAEQHYHTFTERMAEFPFDIARLSRFCSTKEQREIVEGLFSGRIDIVIGTHRLASKDVRFHNLGLVIIDEEQRFGVNVKERLKRLRATVDILTMTATPIPRTLHMSLVGVRDISNLETPPEERVAIETRLARFDRDLVRRAVLRELNRDGQIFFVHNRVQDIEIVAEKLRQIVPEATIEIAHGQMHEDRLAQVMIDFVAHRFDLLLATTIVESGLDIPNANTIFIDEANRYGLADLHQLRGRVGRYKHRAFCYLLIDPHKNLTPNAAKRLRAIEEFSEMGAGFAISMRDLEIRGAGNLLGHQQSGHIAAVGYEFYCQLLETAVRTLKQMPRRLSIDVDIDLPGEAYFPDRYVPDMRVKIDLYRRLRRAANFDELREFREELTDRFGTPPDPVRRLLELAELRLDAAVWQITALHTEDKYLVLAFSDQTRIRELQKTVRTTLRIVDGHHAYCPLPDGKDSPDDYFEVAKSVLRPRDPRR